MRESIDKYKIIEKYMKLIRARLIKGWIVNIQKDGSILIKEK